MRRSAGSFFFLCALALTALAPAAQAGGPYADGGTDGWSAPDITDPSSTAQGYGDVDLTTGDVSAFASARDSSPLPTGAAFFVFDVAQFGVGTSMAGGGAWVSRSFPVTPGHYVVTVVFTGLAAAAEATLGTGLYTTGSTSARLGALFRCEDGCPPQPVTFDEGVSRGLACAPAKPDCATASTVTLEKTVAVDRTGTIRVSGGVGAGATANGTSAANGSVRGVVDDISIRPA